MIHIDMIPLGRTIQLWRTKRGLSQSGLARLAGMSRPNLSVIEQGGRDMTVETLRRIALALDVHAGALVDGAFPGESEKQVLTREGLDRIARWAVGEKIKLSASEKKIGQLVKSVVKQKLGTTKVLPRTSREEKQNLTALETELSPAEFKNLLSRIDKQLWVST